MNQANMNNKIGWGGWRLATCIAHDTSQLLGAILQCNDARGLKSTTNERSAADSASAEFRNIPNRNHDGKALRKRCTSVQ